MTLQELQNELLHLPLSDRWCLVKALLQSLQQETLPSSGGGGNPEVNATDAPFQAIALNTQGFRFNRERYE
ncbi:MAG: hypothetical protein ACO31I_14975 [Prochlorotrichaceae cyanobacterium]|jgi:hypothetical protein